MDALRQPAHARTHRLVLLAFLLGLGVLLSALEVFYLPPLPVPGAKVGLAHVVTLLLVAYFRPSEAVINIVLRVILVSLMTGTFLTTIFFFSLAGSLASYAVMLVLFMLARRHVSFLGISVAGSVSHNITQLAVAVWLLGHWGIALHLPLLIVVGVATGSFNGLLVNFLSRRAQVALPAWGPSR